MTRLQKILRASHALQVRARHYLDTNNPKRARRALVGSTRLLTNFLGHPLKNQNDTL